MVLERRGKRLIEAREQPIVTLHRRSESTIASEVAPAQYTLGVMLPYTPLNYLLLSNADPAILVMTSGNLSEEPIATENNEARQRLSGLADALLMHNRPIRTRCDDSVARVFQPAQKQSRVILRRGRGYTPDPIRLPCESPPLLVIGPELKNTFCLARGPYAFLSHNIGDLENFETLQSFEDGITHFERLLRIQPEAIAHDLHPNYLATHYALDRAERQGLPVIGVQHHHAHIAAYMVENRLDGAQPVIDVAFDGTGYSTDGIIWGGEFLVADYAGFQRAAHLAYISGGKMSHDLIERLFLPPLDNLAPRAGDDSGVVQIGAGARLAISTDAHVVALLFFPGGRHWPAGGLWQGE